MEQKNQGMIYQREIQLQTSGHRQMHDLTGEVARIVSESGVRRGLVHIFNVGSTGAIGTIEFEPGLQQDLPTMLDKLFPASHDAWPLAHGSGPRRPTGAGHLAAGFSLGMRRQAAPAHDHDHGSRTSLTSKLCRPCECRPKGLHPLEPCIHGRAAPSPPATVLSRPIVQRRLEVCVSKITSLNIWRKSLKGMSNWPALVV